MATHEVFANPETVHWGYFDYRLEPILTIDSGDRVIVHTLSGHPMCMPEDPSRYPEELTAIHQTSRKGAGPHILLGPIHVEGAEPGDTLEVLIEAIKPRCDWGYNLILPLNGALPEDYPKVSGRVIDLNLEEGTAEVAPGWNIPLSPFFGVLGVCPPEELGEIPSNPPYVHGGNMDNKELTAGSKVYLPVWKRGAGFSVGDGHSAQGDGEVNLTAIESPMEARLRLTVRKDLKLRWPRAESPTHHITMGFNTDLDDAAKQALREMIDFLHENYGLNRDDAYVFCSTAVDLHVTQLVNGHKGIHAMVAKVLLPN